MMVILNMSKNNSLLITITLLIIFLIIFFIQLDKVFSDNNIINKKISPNLGFNFLLWNTGENDKYKLYIDTLDRNIVKSVSISYLYKFNKKDMKNDSLYRNISLNELKDIIKYINSKGIKVVSLKPQIQASEKSLYIPNNKHIFLQSYKKLIQQDTLIAKKLGVDYIILSTELPSITNSNKSDWKSIVDLVHTNRLKVGVSLDFNAKEYNTCVFLDLVDIIGFNIYPYISDKGAYSKLEYCRNNLKDSNIEYTLKKLKEKYKKPFWITETGCTNYERALSKPYGYTSNVVGTQKSNTIQYLYYETTLPFFYQMKYKNKPLIESIYIWSISNYNDIYSPLNNSLAIKVIKKYTENEKYQ